MTWTYTTGWLSVSGATGAMTQIRLLTGDTDATRQQLQDEEIYFVYSVQSAVNYAAADCCDLLSAKYAFQINTKNSELELAAAARHKQYADLAKRLRAAGPGSTPGGDGAGLVLSGAYAGGTSQSDNEALENGDNIFPPFGIGQDDFPTVREDATTYFKSGSSDDDDD